MKNVPRIVIYSVIVWIIGFLIGLILWPIHDTQLMLFKSVITLAGVILSIVFLNLFFNRINSDYVKEGVIFGVIWVIINIGLDLIVLVGLFKSPLIDYLISPGIFYLTMPVMSIGIGYILKKKAV